MFINYKIKLLLPIIISLQKYYFSHKQTIMMICSALYGIKKNENLCN